MSLFRKYRRLFAFSESMPVLLICILCISAVWGCAIYSPRPLDPDPFRQRAVTQTEDEITVSAAVLGAAESETVFGFALYRKGIQPIWLQIENNTRHRMWFAPVSVDRDYFAPLEVAYRHHTGYSGVSKNKIDRHFHQSAIRNSVAPGELRSGFVFTHLEMGTKAFNVDVIGEDNRVRTFTFLIPVEGLQVDHRGVQWGRLYENDEMLAFDSVRDFKTAIEDLPCCTSNADGSRLADPINVVIVGKGTDILYALLRSGWDETAAAASYDPMARLPWEFRYQPVKSLYLFDRPQDTAFRKSRSTLNERNQLRLWLSPFFYEGHNVWIGQISRIIRRSVWDKFVIEPDVDEARTYLLQDLWYAEAISKFGYIRTADVAPISDPRKSLHNDDYFTDGLCLVLWVSGEPVSFSQVQFAPLETPVAERRKLMLEQ
jgi:hypothetical protein